MPQRLTTAVLLIACAVAPIWPVTAAAAPPALPDQLGAEHGVADFAGETLLVIVVTARKAKHIGRWEQALRDDYPELRSLRVADVPDDPNADFEQVAAKLRKRVPENVSILIDMENQWARAYELDTEEPCLLLLDAEHNLITTFRGRAKRNRVQEVKAALQEYMPAAAAGA